MRLDIQLTKKRCLVAVFGCELTGLRFFKAGLQDQHGAGFADSCWFKQRQTLNLLLIQELLAPVFIGL